MERPRLASSLVLAAIALLGWSSIAGAQWTGLANAFPSGHAEHCLLLTDGTVMCHEYNTNRWHRLKPDINGSYQNGSWDVPGFTVADMPNGNDATFGCVNCVYRPLFFASAVLADGRVVVIGGEYINLSPSGATSGSCTIRWRTPGRADHRARQPGVAPTAPAAEASATLSPIVLQERNDAARQHRQHGHRVVQSRDADLHGARSDRARTTATTRRTGASCRTGRC